jgi:Ca-activated chloride channel family protein
MLQEARPGALERAPEDSTLTGRTEVYWLLAAAAFVLGLLEITGIVRQLREVRPAGRPLRAPHGGQRKERAR